MAVADETLGLGIPSPPVKPPAALSGDAAAAASAANQLAAAVLAAPGNESDLSLQIYALEVAVLDNALRHFAPQARAACERAGSK
ncbi:MAG: hypothetical protein ABUL60_14835 [Myxococcales bacterium]